MPTTWIVYAAVAILALGAAWGKGYMTGSERLYAFQAEQAREETRISKARHEIVTKTEIQWRTKIQTVYKTGETIKETVYVTKADDAACTLPVGFVRNYNDAWSGKSTGPAAESDREPSGVPLSEAASAETHNATSCLAYKAQRDGLIEFYRKQQAVR